MCILTATVKFPSNNIKDQDMVTEEYYNNQNVNEHADCDGEHLDMITNCLVKALNMKDHAINLEYSKLLIESKAEGSFEIMEYPDCNLFISGTLIGFTD